MRLGIAHHYGWATVVAASADHQVVDRRRIELIEPGLPAAPIHHEAGGHELHRRGPVPDDAALDELVQRVRAAVARATAASLDTLQRDVARPVRSISIRAWPPDFPDDVAVLRRAPYESRADSVMYCQILARSAAERGWQVLTFDPRTVEAQATAVLGDRAEEVLHGPRRRLGPPWAKDHRLALAATVVAG